MSAGGPGGGGLDDPALAQELLDALGVVPTGQSACLFPGDDRSVKRLVVDFEPGPKNEVACRES